MNSNENKTKRKIVLLTITEDCNLKCTYCFEQSKTNKFMSIDLAKSIVEHELNNSNDFDEVEFDLFGGEPTLYIDLIKDLVEWTYKKKFNKPHLFFLETNGTLIDNNFKKWLLEYDKYVYAGISLDGTRESHNKNRCNSYDLIDINFFIKTYPLQSIRMTISNNTIGDISNNVIHLHKLGFNEVIASFAHGIKWDFNAEILENQLHILCNYYLNNPGLKECSIFHMNLIDILNKNEVLKKWCGTGTTMISYGVDGTSYPCHTFQPNTKSNLNNMQIDFNSIVDYRDNDCKDCIIEAICPNCYGMNFVSRGNILKRDKGLCKIIKIRAIATSYLRAQQIERKLKDFAPNDLFQTIKAINKIQNDLHVEC